jgi:uncharacterized protein YutE (UPF0331/DUF86 family)
MVNEDLISAKLAELGDRLERVKLHCPATAQALAGDRDALDLVSFNLLLAVQSCADIASHIIADEGWPSAVTLADGFERLREHGVIEEGTARALSRAAGMRNVLAHGYGNVDVAMVHVAASSGTRDLNAFAREVARFLQRSRSGAAPA